MAGEHERAADAAEDLAGDGAPAGGREAVDAEGPGGPGALESLFQEFVRRAATLGLNSFFFTEKALRGALSEAVPDDWVEYAGRQSDELRGELIESLTNEFGAWLRGLDASALLADVLRSNDIAVRLELSAEPARRSADLEITRRRE